MNYIVLIPVDYTNSRKVCERIENGVYNTLENLISNIKAELNEKVDMGRNGTILYFELSDFMDEVNNQELDNLTEYFITYVHIKYKQLNFN